MLIIIIIIIIIIRAVTSGGAGRQPPRETAPPAAPTRDSCSPTENFRDNRAVTIGAGAMRQSHQPHNKSLLP